MRTTSLPKPLRRRWVERGRFSYWTDKKPKKGTYKPRNGRGLLYICGPAWRAREACYTARFMGLQIGSPW